MADVQQHGLQRHIARRRAEPYIGHSYIGRNYIGHDYIGHKCLSEPYHNPGATVHVMTGAAGCREGDDTLPRVGRGPWSAVRNSEYGYGRLLVANRTHLRWEQIEEGDESYS